MMKRQKVKIIEEKEGNNFLSEFFIWILMSLAIFLGCFLIFSITQWVFGINPFDPNDSLIFSIIGTIVGLCAILSKFSYKKHTIKCEKIVFIEGVNNENSSRQHKR